MAHPQPQFQRRLLLVEDEQLTRSLISNLLSQRGFEVQTCGNATDAAALAANFDPDVMVVDISLGDGPTGLDLIRAMRNAYPHIAFVVLSNYAALPAALNDFHQVAYLRKRDVADPEMLITAVEQVLRDADPSNTFPIAQTTELSALTKTQLDVLALMTTGLSNQEIASRRGTTVESTEQLIGRIYRTLGLNRDGAKSLRVQATHIYASVMGAQGSE